MGDYITTQRKKAQYNGRTMPNKRFYVFLCGQYDRKYAILEAPSFPAAIQSAYAAFGFSNISSVQSEEIGKGKAESYGFEEVNRK
jgi:hypothetical protein